MKCEEETFVMKEKKIQKKEKAMGIVIEGERK